MRSRCFVNRDLPPAQARDALPPGGTLQHDTDKLPVRADLQGGISDVLSDAMSRRPHLGVR